MSLTFNEISKSNASAMRKVTSQVVTSTLESIAAAIPDFRLDKTQLALYNTSIPNGAILGQMPDWGFSPLMSWARYEGICRYCNIPLSVKFAWLARIQLHFPMVQYMKTKLALSDWKVESHNKPKEFRDNIFSNVEAGWLRNGIVPLDQFIRANYYIKDITRVQSATSTVINFNMDGLPEQGQIELARKDLAAAHKRYLAKVTKQNKEQDTEEKTAALYQKYLQDRYMPMLKLYNKYTAPDKLIALGGL